MSYFGSAAARDAPAAFNRQEQWIRKRVAVLHAASQAFSDRGFANTSMDDIAAALGVSKPTLYQYFRSKQEILFECHKIAMDHGEAGLALATAHTGTGLGKLALHLDRYLRGIFGDFGPCPALTDVDSLGLEHRSAVIARRANISAATADLIRIGIEDGSIINCDPKLATLFALGALNWISLWYRETGPNTPNEIIQAFLAFLQSGLSNSRERRRPGSRGNKA